jgi:hypothetical protein
MADLEKRDEYEQLMALLLVSMFIGQPLGFWIGATHSPDKIFDQLNKAGIDKLIQKINADAVREMVTELKLADSVTDLTMRVQAAVARQKMELVERLTASVRKWSQSRDEAIADGRRPPPMKEILKQYQAERHAITETTRVVTAAEFATRDHLRIAYGINTTAIFKTEADSRVCPICSPMHNQSESIWRVKFPSGPPLHPRCRCWLHWVRALGN